MTKTTMQLYATPDRAKTRPRRVRWDDPTDLEAMLLATMGISAIAICQQTGLTYCQVAYRCQKASIRIGDYRHIRRNTLGGLVARQEIELAKKRSRPLVADYLAQELPAKHAPKINRRPGGKKL